jgi:hypothetical protein
VEGFMALSTRFILLGMDKRLLLEGAISDIHIELTEMLEDLRNKIKRSGDFQFGNTLNPNYISIKSDFDKLIQSLDKWNLNAEQFVSDTIKKNPNVTFLEMLDLLQEKYL